jgi:hypothetical protein
VRRLWVLPLLALVFAACGDDGNGSGDAARETTDDLAVTDEPEADELIGGDPTGTRDDTGDGDDPSEIAPTVLLDSFTGSFETEFQFPGGSIVLRSDATFVDGDQDCTVNSDAGAGEEQEERAVVVGDDAFYEQGGEGVRTDLDDPDVVQVLTNCVSSDAFWDGFPSDLPAGEPADFNGIPAQRIDLLEAGEQLDESLDLPAGFDAEQFDIWIADDGGFVVGASIRYSGPARSCRELLGGAAVSGEPCTVRIDVRIADPDDGSLRVTLPRAGADAPT